MHHMIGRQPGGEAGARTCRSPDTRTRCRREGQRGGSAYGVSPATTRDARRRARGGNDSAPGGVAWPPRPSACAQSALHRARSGSGAGAYNAAARARIAYAPFVRRGPANGTAGTREDDPRTRRRSASGSSPSTKGDTSGYDELTVRHSQGGGGSPVEQLMRPARDARQTVPTGIDSISAISARKILRSS